MTKIWETWSLVEIHLICGIGNIAVTITGTPWNVQTLLSAEFLHCFLFLNPLYLQSYQFILGVKARGPCRGISEVWFIVLFSESEIFTDPWGTGHIDWVLAVFDKQSDFYLKSGAFNGSSWSHLSKQGSRGLRRKCRAKTPQILRQKSLYLLGNSLSRF